MAEHKTTVHCTVTVQRLRVFVLFHMAKQHSREVSAQATDKITIHTQIHFKIQYLISSDKTAMGTHRVRKHWHERQLIIAVVAMMNFKH